MNSIKVGVGVLIIKNNKVLLGHRVATQKDTGGIYEPGSWTCPGGKQEFNETIFDCAIREVKEETNLDLIENDLEVIGVNDDIQPDKHYVTISVLAKNYQGSTIVMEEDTIDEWKFFDLNDLPENIYSPSRKTINCYINKVISN